MQCPKCGSDVQGKFCSQCGTRMPDEAGSTRIISREMVSDLRSMTPLGPNEVQDAKATPSEIQEPDPFGTMRVPRGQMFGADRTETATSPSSSATQPQSDPTPRVPPSQSSTGGAPFVGSESGGNVTTLQRFLIPLESMGKQMLTWIGAALLLVGLFLPTKTFSTSFLNISVSVKLWDYAGLFAILLLLLAIASAALAYIRDFRWLWLTGGIGLVILLLEFLDALTSTGFHPSYGWILLFPGIVLILLAAAMRNREGETTGDAIAYVNNLVGRGDNRST